MALQFSIIVKVKEVNLKEIFEPISWVDQTMDTFLSFHALLTIIYLSFLISLNLQYFWLDSKKNYDKLRFIA